MKLDRSRPYGHVMGSEIGAVYEQDGHAFDASGNEVGAPAIVETAKQAADMNKTLSVPKK